MAVEIKVDDCVGCGICVDLCPAAALDINAEGKAEVTDDCVECGACVDSCPNEAIEL